jgi:phospholipase C
VALVCAAACSIFSASDGLCLPPHFPTTATPIRYLVVIFQENNSFDHYFGTYPHATNPPDEPPFFAARGTPTVNGLTGALLTANPNFLNSANGAGAVNPFRLDRSQALTCDNINHYKNEQEAYASGLMDLFPTFTSATNNCPEGIDEAQPGLAMGYYDGNTVTALWNYAQRYAMSDNFFGTEFGTTVMGHLNLVSGDTHQTNVASNADIVNGSVIANINPPTSLDDCSSGTSVEMTSKNVGDLLNAQGITWGWFYGDFGATSTTGVTPATCDANYNPHYDPFQYYASTANPHHLPPSSISAIGQASDQANHQYDLTYFFQALAAGNLPSVSFVKAPFGYTGHPSDGSVLQEQTFLVNTINQLEQSPEWSQMAVIVTYDDSDGWYDHVMPPIVNQSHDSAQDALTGPTTLCGTLQAGAYNDRCGYGPRLPLLVLSPFARSNYVDHALTDQTSILRFIEDNWNLGRIGDQSFDIVAGSILGLFDFEHASYQRLFLDPDSGEPPYYGGY